MGAPATAAGGYTTPTGTNSELNATGGNESALNFATMLEECKQGELAAAQAEEELAASKVKTRQARNELMKAKLEKEKIKSNPSSVEATPNKGMAMPVKPMKEPPTANAGSPAVDPETALAYCRELRSIKVPKLIIPELTHEVQAAGEAGNKNKRSEMSPPVTEGHKTIPTAKKSPRTTVVKQEMIFNEKDTSSMTFAGASEEGSPPKGVPYDKMSDRNRSASRPKHYTPRSNTPPFGVRKKDESLKSNRPPLERLRVLKINTREAVRIKQQLPGIKECRLNMINERRRRRRTSPTSRYRATSRR